MKITFKNRSLLKLANNEKRRIAAMGKIRADKFNRRLVDLLEAENLEMLRFLPGNYHELNGDRKNQWACDLDQPYRLIFMPHQRPALKDLHSGSVSLEIQGVEIVEIVDYH